MSFQNMKRKIYLHIIFYTHNSNILTEIFLITKLQMVNISVDTYVNHPWLRLRRVFSRLSLLRGDPLRDPVQGHTFLLLDHQFGRKVGPYAHTDLTDTCTFIDRPHCAEPTSVFVEKKNKKKEKEKKKRRNNKQKTKKNGYDGG